MPLLDGSQQKFVVDTMIQYDRANDGKSPKEMIDMVLEVNSDLSRKQASQTINWTIRPKATGKGGIKPKPVKAQAMTTKRSVITVKQQFRWHMTVEKVFDFLRRMNTGVCCQTGKSFGEVMHHFIIGGDETCFQVSDIGNAMVVAEYGNKKPEKKSQVSRDSITLYRTGAIGGATGLTAFLMKGKMKRSGFTNEFLMKHGAVEGSTIVMTPTAFMMEEAWDEMSPDIV